MNKGLVLWSFPIFLLVFFQSIVSGSEQPKAAFKGSFIENKGQWENNILYKADLPYGSLFLESNCLTFNFVDQKSVNRIMSYKFEDSKDPLTNPPPASFVPAHAYKVYFEGASSSPEMTTSAPYPEYYNYYLGKDTSHWTSMVKPYQSVTYKSLYPGIDLQVHQQHGNLKYTFLLEAGADSRFIRMNYQGVEGLKIRKGKLIVKTTVNTVEELAPLAWQPGTDGKNKIVRCRFSLQGNTLTFRFPDGIDHTQPLVIDPILVFSSYSGSVIDNWGYTATYDNEGFLYAGGNAFGMGYPTVTGSYQVNFGGGLIDIVISKYDTTGSFLIYSTYLGGSGPEVPASLVVNTNNELLVMGTTGSADFPVTSQSYSQVFQGGPAYTLTSVINYAAGSDLVISKFSADGTNLLASTYFGGSGNDGLNSAAVLKHNYADDVRGEIKVDPDQNVYICSSTQSSDLAVSSLAAQPVYGGQQDACIARFDPSLTYLLWSTYLGGSGGDAGYSLIIDDEGRVYAAGGTTSSDFPVTAGAFQQNFFDGGSDGFISCLNDNANVIQYSTYFGSTAYDQVFFIDKDKLGNIYALGQTAATGSTFILNAIWAMPDGGQFISKLHPNLSGVIFSTTFGTGNGGPDISPTAFMVDNCNYIYLSGWGGNSLNGFGGTSGLPVTPDAFQTTTDGKDYYFLVMEGDASGLVYATFFGGTSGEHVDGGTSRFDKKGRIYQSVCAGCGGIDDFPTTPGAWSNVNGSTNCNNGVIKFDFKIPLVIADFVQPLSGCAPDTVMFQNTSYLSGPGTVQYFWDFGDGNTSVLTNPLHIYNAPGMYTITLVVTDSESCNQADTISKNLYILGNPTLQLPAKTICINESVQIGINPIPDPGLTYSWFPSNSLNNPSIPNPIAAPTASTDYYLLISNGLCADTIIQHVRVFDLKVNAGNDTIICTATLNLTAIASEDSVFYQWSTNPQFSDTLNDLLTESSIQVVLQNQETWFYVRIFNNYCSATDSIKISFSIFISPGGGQDPLCPDSCDGSAVVNLSGGIPPFSFLWSNGDTTSFTTGLCAGTYTVTVTDSATCVSIATIVLLDPPDLLITLNKTDIPCEEVCNGQLTALVGGGSSPYHYFWSTGQSSDEISGLCQGTYSLTVTDDHDCPDTASISIGISSIFQDIEAYAVPDTIYQGLSTQLFATLLTGCTYLWSPASRLSDPAIFNPIAKPEVTSLYTLTITDPFGCQYVDSVKVIVKEVICREPYIYIPNAFTPNGDNKNDVILVQGNFIEELQIAIYDRWGNRVFETTDPKTSWDGNYNGNACEPGVYVYYLEVGCYNKERFRKKGNITLIR
ncbi:MAG: gliding motility-associated C-terminal domain-containing protein [Bacteroidales bacterium]